MGSCLSTGSEHGWQNSKDNVEPKVAHGHSEYGEETSVVKEVLSETPKPSTSAEREHQVVGQSAQQVKILVGYGEDEGSAYEIYKMNGEEGGMERKVHFAGSPASTTKFQRKQRSMSGEFTCGSESQKLANRSTFSSSPSRVRRPDKGSTLGRSLSGTENCGPHRPSGGGSRRRPGSPAAAAGARSNGVTRSSSFRTTEWESPMPPGYVEHSGTRMAELEHGEPTRGKESLENPLVSLECFIFL